MVYYNGTTKHTESIVSDRLFQYACHKISVHKDPNHMARISALIYYLIRPSFFEKNVSRTRLFSGKVFLSIKG